jgi:hypothetical protein
MLHPLLQTLSNEVFHLPVPVAEELLRPAIVYLCRSVFLGLFDKRELAQLNPFDLAVLLGLSTAVQNPVLTRNGLNDPAEVLALPEQLIVGPQPREDATARRRARLPSGLPGCCVPCHASLSRFGNAGSLHLRFAAFSCFGRLLSAGAYIHVHNLGTAPWMS